MKNDERLLIGVIETKDGRMAVAGDCTLPASQLAAAAILCRAAIKYNAHKYKDGRKRDIEECIDTVLFAVRLNIEKLLEIETVKDHNGGET